MSTFSETKSIMRSRPIPNSRTIPSMRMEFSPMSMRLLGVILETCSKILESISRLLDLLMSKT